MLSSVFDEGLRVSNTLLRTKLSFKIIFLIFIFFLFTFGVLLVDFNTIYSVLLLVFWLLSQYQFIISYHGLK